MNNLLSLCGYHHRLHHQGHLGISGDADRPGGMAFRDPWGRLLDPCGTPIRPTPGASPTEAAEAAGIVPGRYVHPLGERLDPWAMTLHPNPGLDLDLHSGWAGERVGGGPHGRTGDPSAAHVPVHEDDPADEVTTYGTPGWTEPEVPWPAGFDPPPPDD
ncbi:hypothetical protein KSP35_11895 [Aquihabitans sp. G128]|uniref:hypothetical protein n=1 Tax=Aquihabitans sp. G128 TaxID=2849779 RepID=UPI001C22BC17|nr:hypothetical protein [Aquihabitans sp. G128]QXC59117.1 hypothetical protein KSP35_11895 [Aquihabitans sp. G128]